MSFSSSSSPFHQKTQEKQFGSLVIIRKLWHEEESMIFSHEERMVFSFPLLPFPLRASLPSLLSSLLSSPSSFSCFLPAFGDTILIKFQLGNHRGMTTTAREG